jgi:DNA-binding NtrC family response regulator
MISAPLLDPMSTQSKPSSILLVEDDVSLRRSLGDFLKDCGYHPYAVGTMREAWETLQVLRPRVCLLDLNLPDGSGLDLLRRIATERLDVRVIVMTAFPLQHLRPNYPESTLVAWLTKPVAPAALLKAVENAENLDKETRGQRDKGI